MGYFDDIVPPDIASGGYRPLRVTVRPKGFELPPGSGNAGTAADAPDERDKAPPARAGLFDDIVPAAGPGSALRFPADASKETDNAPSARTAGLFDDIVPPARQATGPVAATTEGYSPYYDPMTGIPMTAPRLAPSPPGLPLRPETQAPLNTPSSSWSDLPVRVPRADVPLAVPDPTALGEGFPAPPGPSAMDRIKAAAARGFGNQPLGFSEANRAKYPHTYRNWQPVAAPLDFALRAPGAAIGAISSAGSEIYKALGGTETNANRLERDLNMLGQSAIVEGGIGSRYNIGKPQANLFRTTEGALSDEAAAARQAIAPTVTPTTLRQIPAENSGAVPIQRSGPQPPARPPDKAAAQSDRMNPGARESGPFSLEGGEQRTPIASASAATNSIPTATAAESGPKRIGSFTPRADLKYGGTDFGIHAHQETGSMLQNLYRDADLILRVGRGQKGIDVSVPEEHIARLGFAHAEIKPLSASGEKKMRQQILEWEYDPSTVQAITYDANGNVYFGFR